MMKKRARKLLKEPIVHFLFIGMLIFMISAIFSKEEKNIDNIIEVSKGDVESMLLRWYMQLNRMPSEDELQTFLYEHIREEILFREARAMGLEQNDVIIKRRMVQKIEFLTNDLLDPPPSTNEEIKEYFDEHLESFVIPEKIDFIHIYFNEENRGDEELRSLAAEVKEQLNAFDHIPEDYYMKGDQLMLPYSYRAYTKEDVAAKFGNLEIADELFRIEAGRWEGPFHSSFGSHLVHITGKIPSEVPSLESVRDQIDREIVHKKRTEANDEYLTELKKNYTIYYSSDLLELADSLDITLEDPGQ
jgi:hypothetical protein